MLLSSHPLLGTFTPETVKSRRTLYIRDLVCDAAIGAYDHEKNRKQKISIDLIVEVDPPVSPLNDDLDNVLNYDELKEGALQIVANQHIELQETLCDAIAEFCLTLSSVRSVYVRVGKLEAIKECQMVGCEIVKYRVL